MEEKEGRKVESKEGKKGGGRGREVRKEGWKLRRWGRRRRDGKKKGRGEKKEGKKEGRRERKKMRTRGEKEEVEREPGNRETS